MRAAEAELSTAHERITNLERAHVEHLASAHMAAPEDAALYLPNLDELRGDDGALDPAKVEQQLAALVDAKPHLARRPAHPNLQQGVRAVEPEAPSFAEAFKAAGRG